MVETVGDNTKLVEVNDDNYENYKELIVKSCFPQDEETLKKYGLEKCIRLFPHDSDTSGFFITVLRKLSPDIPVEEKQGKNKQVTKEKEAKFVKDNIEVSQWVKDYYGIIDNFPMEQLVTTTDLAKKISYVSKGVLNVLNADKRNKFKIINFGVKLFSLNKKKVDQEYCQYRICQDGLPFILPFITKRIFFCHENLFVRLLKQSDMKKNEINDPVLQESLAELSYGCIILVSVKDKPKISDVTKMSCDDYNEYLRNNYLDSLCCYISAIRIATMINKEHQFVFNLKYEIEK
jgi:multisite-specific tRNA:(cytosine-C5)-methyltransferase